MQTPWVSNWFSSNENLENMVQQTPREWSEDGLDSKLRSIKLSRLVVQADCIGILKYL
jgi:hypothetical protein